MRRIKDNDRNKASEESTRQKWYLLQYILWARSIRGGSLLVKPQNVRTRTFLRWKIVKDRRTTVTTWMEEKKSRGRGQEWKEETGMTETLLVAGTGHLAERSFIVGFIYPLSLQWGSHSRGSCWSFWLMADEINRDHDQRGSTVRLLGTWRISVVWLCYGGEVVMLNNYKLNDWYCNDNVLQRFRLKKSRSQHLRLERWQNSNILKLGDL